MKILMMGNKESGKTTYMASAFGLLENGQNGFYIKTDSSSTTWFKTLFRSIRQGDYPNLSDKRNSYNFELYHHQKKVLDFEWIDYYGGVITEASADKLTSDIDSSDGMIIFLEATALMAKDNSVHQFRRILALITKKLANSDVGLFTIIVVITKYDAIANGIAYERVVEPLNEFLSSTDENDSIYARVIPVSCTKNGFYNVELPLLDMLDSGMKVSYLSAIAEAKQYADKWSDFSDRIGILDWAVSRLTSQPTNGEIADKYRQKALQKIDLFKSIEEPMKRLSDYVANYSIQLPQSSVPRIVLPSSVESRRFIEL